jgi:hypothetical protein
MKQYLFILALFSLSTPCFSQWLSLPTPGIPRTADGKPDMSAPAPRTVTGTPDMSGLWVAQRVTGDLPLSEKFKPWVSQLKEQYDARFYADEARYNCLPNGPGYIPARRFTLGLRRVVQSPTMIAVLYEDLVHRQIYMDGRELESDPIPSWMGYSAGRWDGDTLVVESNGYNDKTWLIRDGVSHTEQLHITERYTRTDFGHIQLSVTYDDPGAFTSPLEVQVDMVYVADDELLEIVCNEKPNKGEDWSGNITQAEEKAVEIDQDVLASYTGTFEGIWLGNVITLEFRLEEGELKMKRNGEELRLVPQSQTTFDCANGFGYVFITDDKGYPTAVSEVHVSGGWPFPRVSR